MRKALSDDIQFTVLSHNVLNNKEDSLNNKVKRHRGWSQVGAVEAQRLLTHGIRPELVPEYSEAQHSLDLVPDVSSLHGDRGRPASCSRWGSPRRGREKAFRLLCFAGVR